MDRFYGSKDLVNLLDVSPSKAYNMIRAWNKELESKGYTTVAGKVVKAYADEKLGFNIKNMEDICNA